MFKRDAHSIRRAAESSPEVTANAIIFAILTANAPLRHSVNAALWVRSKGESIMSLTYQDITKDEKSLMGNAMNTAKLGWVQNVLANKEEIFGKYQDMTAIEFWNYLLDNVPGLGLVKAAFAVQMLYNELGCIDTHNLRMHNIDKNAVVGKTKAKRANYLKIQAVKSSESWWTDWCNVVAKRFPRQYESADYVSRLHTIAVIGD